MTMVYVLATDEPYEGNTPVLAFTTEAAAVDCIRRMRELDASYPPKPDSPDTTGEEWESWFSKFYLWAQNHPAGERFADYRTHFTIIAVPLRTA